MTTDQKEEYPFSQMKVHDCFFVPETEADALLTSISTAATRHYKAEVKDTVFSVKRVIQSEFPDGCVVTRIR